MLVKKQRPIQTEIEINRDQGCIAFPEEMISDSFLEWNGNENSGNEAMPRKVSRKSLVIF
jgi:hypothetical protein